MKVMSVLLLLGVVVTLATLATWMATGMSPYTKFKIVETIEVEVDPDDPFAGTGFFEGTTEEKTVERDAFQLGIFPTAGGLIDKHMVSVATILFPVWSLIGIGAWRRRRAKKLEGGAG
ncbi:MAG: hypothetical protein O7H41_00785 [Planctomycetota bacterium]|nr:hypothetical protein [Planctomycetota bacterium]